VTWSFEKVKDGKAKCKSPLTSHHRAEDPARQPIIRSNQRRIKAPVRDKETRNLYVQILVSTSSIKDHLLIQHISNYNNKY
jgi:hypothetical protein